jgi:hypothetical protein
MANDSSDGQQPARLSPGTAEPSLCGALLLLLACLPYGLLVAMLPSAGGFPNEGGGEARMGWEFQQFWAYAACGATLVLLSLALWRASRSGGIAEWARQTMPALVPAACAAMVFAIAQNFEHPDPWLPLVPILLPPAIGGYALFGCLPALSRWLPRAKTDAVAIASIAALSLAVIPLGMLDAASYSGRLERHHAELAAADAAARALGEQQEQVLRAKFARLGPDSSLRDYLETQHWYLSGVDILAGARQVKTRQIDAISMLDDGMILDLTDLWQLDLAPTQTLCDAYGKALAAAFGRSEIGPGSAFLNLISAQFSNMHWLQEARCDLDAPVTAIDARLGWMIESKDPSGAAANDAAAYYSRWGVSRDTIEATRVKLAGFRGAR